MLVVDEFWRILKPNGRLVLTVPFGDRHMTDELRVYDSEQINELTKRFHVRKRDFYRKAPDGAYWSKCSEAEASSAGCAPVSGVQGVVLLLCEKPS